MDKSFTHSIPFCQAIIFSLVMLANSGLVLSASTCEGKYTSIAAIQGAQSSSPLVDKTVWVKGIVTGDFRGQDALGGFFIQSEQASNDPLQSSGLFVSENNPEQSLNVGDVVVIKGQVSEQFDVTQISSVDSLNVCDTEVLLPMPVPLELPMTADQLEAVEGMRVSITAPHVITDVYNYVRYGELIVSSQLLLSPTAMYRPGKQAQSHRKTIKSNQLIIDDGRLSKYPQPFVVGADGLNPIQATTALQLGQRIDVTGVMHFAFGKYKLQPTEKFIMGQPTEANRSSFTKPKGRYQVGTFNVENFFTTIDNGEEVCGPLRDFGCRGADSKAEYDRQLAKLVSVINTADATVMGLQELENNANASIKALVKGLNNAAGEQKWAYIDTGILGEDVIKVGFIYQPSQVMPQGEYALLNSAADPEFKENKNRIIVAQTFSDKHGNAFNVAVVHFKSKSCRDATGLLKDQKDGQGCYNPTRVEVANQLAKWINQDPTGQGVAATYIVGDFNSYQYEDPMETLKTHGFINLANQYLGKQNWTTSFRGTIGSLDYVLANEAAQKLSKGLVQWHINSISSKEFSYNMETLEAGISKPESFYQPDPYASSDHDVVMAGFEW